MLYICLKLCDWYFLQQTCIPHTQPWRLPLQKGQVEGCYDNINLAMTWYGIHGLSDGFVYLKMKACRHMPRV